MFNQQKQSEETLYYQNEAKSYKKMVKELKSELTFLGEKDNSRDDFLFKDPKTMNSSVFQLLPKNNSVKV